MPRATVHVCQNDLPAGLSFPHGMAVDTETKGLNIPRDRLCLVQVGDHAGNIWLVQFDGQNWDAPNLKKHLTDAGTLKLFHFARFDVAVLKHYLNVDTAPLYCTKIASKLTRTYTDRHSLRTLCEELLGELLDKTEQQTDWSVPELTDAQKHYAAADVLFLHKLKDVLDAKLKADGRVDLFNACIGFLPHRCALDLAGWPEVDIFAHH